MDSPSPTHRVLETAGGAGAAEVVAGDIDNVVAAEDGQRVFACRHRGNEQHAAVECVTGVGL